jgi:hypothetical protein
VYEITDEGEATFRRWMAQTLSAPAREYPIFPAALAEVALLAPEHVCDALKARAVALTAALDRVEADLAAAAHLPRVLLLENEFDRATTAAELAWVRALIVDLRAGRLTWSQEQLREVAAETNPAV